MCEIILILLILLLYLSPKIAGVLSFSSSFEAITGMASRLWHILIREPGHQLSGFIFDADSDSPIVNVRLEIQNLSQKPVITRVVFTDTSGFFNLNCPPGNYQVRVHKGGYALPQTSSKKLLRCPEKHFLGEPVNLISQPKAFLKIALRAANPKVARQRAASVGRFQRMVNLLSILILPLLAIGMVVTISDLFYSINLADFASAGLYLLLGILAVRRLLLPRVRGRVIDLESRKAIGGAIIHVFKTARQNDQITSKLVSAATADSYGRFRLALPAANYHLFASKFDYQTMKADRLALKADYAETEVKIHLIHHLSATEVHQKKIKFLRSGN